jgi:heptosyltransferase-2
MKIAVFQPKMIGDVLITSVVFEALRTKFPQAELHYIINKNTMPVVANNPYIDKFLWLEPQDEKSLSGFLKQLKLIRKEHYTIIIDSYAKLKTALICRFSGATKTISFHKTYTDFLYTETVVRNKFSKTIATKAIEHRMLLLEPLHIPFHIIKPKIYLTDAEKANAKTILAKYGISTNHPIVMISALGSSDSKTYPFDYMAKVLDEIGKIENIQILFNYIPNQKEQAHALYHLCSRETQQKIAIDFYAQSLREFMAVTSLCQALLGNEGGATNMAKALSVPTFTIFSPFILKNDWNIFENGTTNVSVHLSDFDSIEIPKKSTAHQSFYELLKPELFKNLLISFLENNIPS